MVEMEREDGVVARHTRQQTRMLHVSGRGKRKSVVREAVGGNVEKAEDLAVGRRTSARFARLGCGVVEGGYDRDIALERSMGKKIGMMNCGGRKRKSPGNSERVLPGTKTAEVSDCDVGDDCGVDEKLTDEVERETGVRPGTGAPSCVAHRTRSQFQKLTSGITKAGGNNLEGCILIDDSDDDSDGAKEERDEEDFIKDGEDVDNFALGGNGEDKSNEDDLGQKPSVGVEADEMSHWNVPVAICTPQQIITLYDKFSKRRKLEDDSAEDGCTSNRGVGEVEEKTRDSSDGLEPSCVANRTRSQFGKLKCGVNEAGDNNSDNVIQIGEKDDKGNSQEEEEDEDDDAGDMIKGGKDKEDFVIGWSRKDENKDDESNEYVGVKRKRSSEDVSSYLQVSHPPMCVARPIKSHNIKWRSDFTEDENNRLDDSIQTVDNVDDNKEEEMEKEDEEEKDTVKGYNMIKDSIEDNSEDEYNEDDLMDDSVEEESSGDEHDEEYLMDDSVEEESSETEYDEDYLKKYKVVDGKEGGDSEEELLLFSNDEKNPDLSSDTENEFSVDAFADISRGQMPACVALRTRSHFKAQRSDIMKDGTFSNPCCLDSDEDDENIALHHNSTDVHEDILGGKCRSFEFNERKLTSASEGGVEFGDEDDQNIALHDNNSSDVHKDLWVGKCRGFEFSKRELISASEGGVDCMQIPKSLGEESRPPDRRLNKRPNDTRKIQPADSAREKRDECRQKLNGLGRNDVTPSKRKHIRQAYDARKVLLEAIWGQRDSLQESIGIVIPKVGRITNWKFDFGEELQPVEKSEAELEFDKLWMEFEFCLRSCEIESGNADMVENGDLLQPRLDPCIWGSHDAILDEEIGFKCRHCSIILQEIRDVVVPFRKDPVEKYVKRDFGSFDDDLFRKLPTETITNDLNHGFPSAKDGTVWDLIPGIKCTLYPHQREGFEFIWKNVAGAVNLCEARRLKESNDGSGCIISHAPGTGKSRLTIVFLQAYLRFFPDCRPVIIAPKSMLLTWEDEFKKWNVDTPFHNVNNNELSGKEDAEALAILARLKYSSPRKEILRMVKLYSWKCQSSVLGISYTLFEKLTFARTTEEDAWSEGNVLLKLPGVLVLDEGHTPRNNDTLIWQALSSVRTQKRICLSGTPFQNNFDELFNTFCMARPGFASTMSHGNKGNGIKRRGHKPSVVKANWANLTNSICENNVEELDNLKAMISPFVHVYTGNVLQDTLPGLSHKIIYLRPGSLQKSLLQSADGILNIMERRHIVSLISVHPSLLLQHPSAVIGESFPEVRELRGMQLTPQDGVKTKFLIEFLRLTDALKEKVLVFSDYIDPLIFLKDQLKSCFSWTEGEEILYMDGKLDVKQRQASIGIFNEEDSNVKVLLASKKACCEGISLVGASRVVFLDAAWNPSVQRQAISRAYRLGQKKFVYVYHLITFATIEEEVYRLQMRKDRISNMVFPSAKGTEINAHRNSTEGPEDKILLEMLEYSTITNLIEKVV